MAYQGQYPQNIFSNISHQGVMRGGGIPRTRGIAPANAWGQPQLMPTDMTLQPSQQPFMNQPFDQQNINLAPNASGMNPQPFGSQPQANQQGVGMWGGGNRRQGSRGSGMNAFTNFNQSNRQVF